MNMFDVVESDLREQIVVLESENKVLKSKIIELEKEISTLQSYMDEETYESQERWNNY